MGVKDSSMLSSSDPRVPGKNPGSAPLGDHKGLSANLPLHVGDRETEVQGRVGTQPSPPAHQWLRQGHNPLATLGGVPHKLGGH
jgi:hypothetical protein